MIRPGNELLTDRHRAAARWLPTTALAHWTDCFHRAPRFAYYYANLHFQSKLLVWCRRGTHSVFKLGARYQRK